MKRLIFDDDEDWTGTGYGGVGDPRIHQLKIDDE